MGYSSTIKLALSNGIAFLFSLLACRPQMSVNVDALVDGSRQVVVVTTPDWASTTGTMQRFERAATNSQWSQLDSAIPVVVGRTGIAWGVGFDDGSENDPRKQEGDGKAPAGIFPLDTAFGFASRPSTVKLPYVQLLPTTDCVDDTASAHYNTVVDRAKVTKVDWNSAEHMRAVGQYEVGVIVGYNARPPLKGRGSCIFLHIWAGPQSHTAGCTAFDETKLTQVIEWLDPEKRPLLVQLTSADYARLRQKWNLPAI
jgi:L,D-peptidoglycan transpeptidase YkuD (ErfK/YbiS/YcfS/YnhG family)